MGSFELKDAWMRVSWRGVCVWQREMSREVAFASESCKAPTRPLSTKLWAPAMAGDDVIAHSADFALSHGSCGSAYSALSHVIKALLPSLEP